MPRPPTGASPSPRAAAPPPRRSRRHARDARGRRRRRRALGRPGRAVARRGRRRRRPSATHAAAVVARVALRYDDAKADLVHDDEYEAVLFPLGDARRRHDRASAVDYDDRDLRDAGPGARSPTGSPTRRSPRRRSGRSCQRDLVDHLDAQPGDRDPDQRGRSSCSAGPASPPTTSPPAAVQVADDRADAEVAKLRDKYEAKVAKLQAQMRRGRPTPPTSPTSSSEARQRDDLLSSAGSILGGLLGGRRSHGRAARSAGPGGRAHRQDVGGRVAGRGRQGQGRPPRGPAARTSRPSWPTELTEIDARWRAAAAEIDTMSIGLEKSDVKVTQLALAWMPAP